MAYTKQTFTSGQTLKASDLNTMSQGIVDKQDKLVSGESLKTVNGQSLLGSGDIVARGEKGETGNSGYTGSLDELEIVNNLTQGGDTAALSAEMGKRLNLKFYDAAAVPLAFSRTAGYYIASNGIDLTAAGGHSTSDFIDVSGDSVVYVTASVGQIYGTVAAYDADKNFLRWLVGGSKTLVKQEVTIANDVKFIRVNSNITSALEVYRDEYTDKFEKVKESVDVVAEVVAAVKSDNYNTNYSALDNGTITHGWILKDGTVKTYDSSSQYFVTDFISVTAGETYYIDATKNAAGITVGGYAEDQSFVLSLLALGDHTKAPVTIPNGVAYVRVSSNASPTISTVSYTAKVEDVDTAIKKLCDELYTDYKEIRYDENELYVGFVAAGGSRVTSYSGYSATPFIDVREYDEVYVTTSVTNTDVYAYFTYDKNQSLIAQVKGTHELTPVTVKAKNVAYIRMNGQGVIPKVYAKALALGGASKKKIEKNLNWVGMSIWWYDGRAFKGSSNGGGELAKGYQTLLRERFNFLSDSGTSYCYSGNSLGGKSDSDANCIMLKASNWAASENAIWTLDTITNDFKLNIPIGTTDDFDNATGVLTYYGALRAFKDKVEELSGTTAIVIASNALRRNNSGYTSTSKNSNGDTLESFEQALIYACMKSGWYFVDQYRLCGLSDNALTYATLDGLHPNNLGFRMAVVPWYTVFNMIHDSLVG